jgi:hypothetical protein
MKRTVFFFAAVVACAQIDVAGAQSIRYLGRGSAPDSAIIVDDANHAREVRKGDAVAGIGQLSEIDDEEIALERVVSDGEREQLRASGLVAPDIVRVRIARPPRIESLQP